MPINNKNYKHKYSDKMAEMQVLACLIKDPMLFTDNKYKFNIEDFGDQFHRILFGAIENIALNGAQSISYIDIDQFLNNYPTQYKVFSDNQGPDYVINMLELVDEKNKDYYYKRMKKMSVLNEFYSRGFDVTSIYDDTIVDPVVLSDMQHKFDAMSVDDIILSFDSQLTQIKEKFTMSGDMEQNLAGDGLDELIASFETNPDMGLPFPSAKLTTIFKGMMLGKLIVVSAPSGQGKTRIQGEISARTAVGEYYDLVKCRWVSTGMHEPVLYISIELKLDELQTIWVSTISGVPEHHILDGKCTKEEKERVAKAKELIKKANLYFVSISDYDVEDIENIVKKYYQLHGVHYVFFDYLSSSLKIMAEAAQKTRMGGLREDQILYMFATRLKELCNRLKIFMWTSTQLSGDWKNVKEADQQLLRGAKAMADKFDGGAVLLPVRESDKPVIAAHVAKGFELEPTHVLHIFKVRRGRYNNIKLYIHFDRSTCRVTDCFVTDKDGVIIDVEDTNVEIVLDQTQEDNEIIANPMQTPDDTDLEVKNEEIPPTKVAEFDGFNF